MINSKRCWEGTVTKWARKTGRMRVGDSTGRWIKKNGKKQTEEKNEDRRDRMKTKKKSSRARYVQSERDASERAG